MLIYSILTNNKKEFKFLGKSDQNIELMQNALTEFKKHKVEINDLKFAIENTEDKYLKIKLQDLLNFYEKYEQKIENKYIDENDELTILANQLEKTNMFSNATIYIDEFVGFTKQEYAIIEKLLLTAKQVIVTVTTDNLDYLTNPDTDIFYSNKQTASKLIYLAKSNKIECDKTLFLEETKRFKNEELEHVEQNIYNTLYTKYNKNVENIKLFLASNTYSEVENTAKQIVKLVKNENYRYRDISIITKNLETYSSLIRAIFNNYNIPVFIDEKKELSQNTFIKYIISILDIYAQNWSYDSVINYIKTGFLNLEEDEIYLIENYTRKWGIKGSKWYQGEWKFGEENLEDSEYERIKELREQITNPLVKLKEELTGTKTATQITQGIYKFLLDNKIDEIVKSKKQKLEENGYLEIAKEQELSWNIVMDVLDEIILIFGEDKISFEKYMELVKVGLNFSGLGKIPQTQDQVIVGDVERSRTHKVKAVFILGMNDGVFPAINKKEGFLGDKDRDELKQYRIELAKGTLDALYEDNFSIYKAFTTAENKLFLSYASSNMDGAPLRPSMLITRIKRIFTKLKEESDIVYKEAEVITAKSTFEELIEQLRLFCDGEKIDEIWFYLFNYYMQNNEYKIKLEQAIKALNYKNIPEKISKQNIEKLYGNTLNTSVSKLEKYRNCPFSYYLKYGLNVSPKDNFKVQTIDTGNFMHETIDSFFNIVRERNLQVKELEEEQINKIIEEIIQEKLLLGKNYIFTSTDKYKILTNRLKRVIQKSMKYIIESLKNSDFEVFGNELEFKNGKSYEPIRLDLEDGKRVEITGKIDRVDIAKTPEGKYIRIIDYKSSVKNLDLNNVFAGLQIQLLTYLDATCKIEEVMPAGLLYFNLIEPVITNKKVSDEKIEEEIRKNFKMNGLILADMKVVNMMDKTLETGASSIIPVQIKKDGTFGKKSNVVTKSQFEDLQKYTNKIIKEISNEILKGKINMEPVYNVSNKKTPCEYCDYKSICSFKAGTCGNKYNYIYAKPKDEILEEIHNNI